MRTAHRSSVALVGIAALVALLALALSGCGPGDTIDVTEDDAGVTKVAQVGDRVVVRLAGNPSTGFTWTRTAPVDEDLDASPLEPMEEGEWEFPAGGQLPGEPGVCLFEYAIVGTGTVTLSYEYARSWEDEPAETFTVAIWARE